MNALFILAHQDDEVAAASRILYLVRGGARVHCAFLTNGAATVSASVRDAESRAALASLNVADLHFIGSENDIPDGKLVEHLDRALELIESAVKTIDEIYTLAWEGGHHDHDAAHLVAVAFAKRRNLLESTFELPLYNGFRSRNFRVLSPIGDTWTRRTISLRDGITSSLLCRFYRSQRKTWMGLLPEALIKLVMLRRECIRRVDVARLFDRPHVGPLLYERRFHVPHDRFTSFARPFVAHHFGG
ncbi:MAG TPA: PIG-L family deacetylase [Thermoanaerobaculia bacterium]|nr:PIG-L family deacetylase [Thermoanaerobaculia bacterium]